MEFRDRIKELRRVRAGDLMSNPKNWRVQRATLQGLLREIGYADAILAREIWIDSNYRLRYYRNQNPDAGRFQMALKTDVNTMQDEGTMITTSAGTVNFVGDGVTVTESGGVVTIIID